DPKTGSPNALRFVKSPEQESVFVKYSFKTQFPNIECDSWFWWLVRGNCPSRWVPVIFDADHNQNNCMHAFWPWENYQVNHEAFSKASEEAIPQDLPELKSWFGRGGGGSAGHSGDLVDYSLDQLGPVAADNSREISCTVTRRIAFPALLRTAA